MSLASLTELNLTSLQVNLIASADGEGDEPEPELTPIQEALADFLEGVGDGTADDKKPEFKGWSKTDTTGFENAVEWIEANVDVAGQSTLIDSFLNDWALKWREEQGFNATKTDEDGVESLIDAVSVPTMDDLLADDRFTRGAFWLPLTSTSALPSIFSTSFTEVDEEGNETVITKIGIPDLLTGVEFIEATDPVFDSPFGLQPGPVVTDPKIIENLVRSQVPDLETGAELPAGFLAKRGLLPGIADTSVVPFISTDDIAALFGQPEPTGGRTGGGTPRDVAFDRENLISQTNDLWRDWFLEGPNEGSVAGIVDSYIREAKAFWTGQGGQLDFDNYIRDKLTSQSRYQVLYRQKEEAMTEEQHMAQFRTPISQLGLRDDTFLRQTEAAVTSGGAPSEQLKRVTRTREFQNQGGFSSRLASTVAGLGAGARV